MSSYRFSVIFSSAALLFAPFGWASVPEPAPVPPLDCRKLPSGSIDELVCKDEGLSALNSKMTQVLAEAQARAVDERPSVLKASQRGWLRERNDCWKSRNRQQCVDKSYRWRIAELQATYGLVAANGPVSYRCEGSRASEVVVSFFPTDPPTLIAKRGDKSTLMFAQPSASGTKYQSRNESLWEHQGQAMIVWGRGHPPMRCKPGP